MGFWPVVLNVIRNADVILLVVDARMPQLSTNKELIKKIEEYKNKRYYYVYNKTDLITKKDLKELQKKDPNAYFISTKNKQGTKKLKEELHNMAENHNKKSLRIGIVGYPNVGKSSLINLLAPNTKAKVSGTSGTTKKTQWTRTGNLRIMDSPGVIPYSDKNIGVGITASKDPHKIKHPENVAYTIIEYLAEKKRGVLETFYKINTDLNKEKKLTPKKLFKAIAEKKGYKQKGGEIDEHRTAITIITDWQKGNITLK